MLWLGAVVALEVPAGAGLVMLCVLREQNFAVPALVSAGAARDRLRMLVVDESARYDLAVYRHLGIKVCRGRWLIVPSVGTDWGAWRRVRCEEVPEGRAIGPCPLGHALTVAITAVLADAPTLAVVRS